MTQLATINQVCQVIATDSQKAKYKAVLPSNINVDAFARTAITAIQNNPSLIDADRDSLYTAVQLAAQDNLLPNGREGALVVFSTKQGDKWIKKVQWMPMVAGIIKRLAEFGFSVEGYAVCENDTFEYQLGDNPTITHTLPKFGTPRGQAIGYYAVATDTQGKKYRAIMERSEIEKIRNASKSKDSGPWQSWYDEMAIKSVIKRLAKRLPLYKEGADSVLGVIDRDNDMYEFKDAPTEAAPAQPRVTRLAAVASQAPSNAQQAPIEGEYSEVADDSQVPDDLPPVDNDSPI